MWGDIVIGKGNQGNSAIKISKIKGDHSISQNSVSFWVSDCILGVGATIFKDTTEGKQFQNLIDRDATIDELQEWLDMMVLKHIGPKRLKQLIEESNERHLQQGRKQKAAEMRAVLGF